MFFRTFFYILKSIARNKILVGWNVLFPLVLATAFYLGFGNLIKEDPDTFQTIEVGYVTLTSEESYFEEVLDELSKETDDHVQVLSPHEYDSKEKAIEAMTEGKVEGVYLIDDEIEAIVPKNGYTATTLNQIVREYDNNLNLISTIAKDYPENLQNVMDTITEDHSHLEEYSFGNNTSQYLQYFFALLAMASLFSSWISTSILMGLCANLSENGKRFECAPVNKLGSILAGILAGLTIQAASNAVAVIYIEYVLQIHFGIPLWNIILITTIGSAVGISIGVLFGAIIKKERLLFAVPLVFTMSCSFFSGLMWGQIKQLIQYHCPIINKLNPAALLTDALYVRATYGATDAYYQNILIMCCIILGCIMVSACFLRRRKYVSL